MMTKITRTRVCCTGWLAIAVALAAGCSALDLDEPAGRTCTLIGCDDGVGIAIPGFTNVTPVALPEGNYELELSYDGVSALCTSTSTRTQRGFDCQEPSQHSASFELGGANATPVRVLARVDGSAPESLTVVLRVDGIVIASETFTPEYAELYPNGRECDVVPCRQAGVEAAVDTRPLPNDRATE